MKRQAGLSSIWLVVGLGILLGIGLYWYTTPQQVPDWIRDWFSAPAGKESTASKPLYRWQDAQGRQHISDEPPQGRPYETVPQRTDVNVVPSATRQNRNP